MEEQQITYIDSFFNQQMNEQERITFEQKCETDTAFAEEVALYVKTKYGFIKEQYKEKSNRFDTLYKLKTHKPIEGEYYGKIINRKYFLVAASILIFCIIGYRFFTKPNYNQLAENYIKENFTILSSTMAADGSEIQKGIGLYNEGKYNEALQIFENEAKTNSPDAIKFSGITHLKIGNYNQAISYFTALEKMNLQSNPGYFYHALTLIKSGKTELAKPIIEKIKAEKLEGFENI